MKPIEKLVSILEQIYSHHCWCGWKKTDEFSFGSRGCFLAFQTIIHHHEITITSHDYRHLVRGPGYSLERGVFRRRALGSNERYWIELTVKDKLIRYGRRAIVPRIVFRSSDTNFERVSALFDEIKAKNKVFLPHAEDCLSVDQSILALCNDLSTQVPA